MTRKVGLLVFLIFLVLALPMVAGAETSGTCGDNLTWTLDDEGTLTIRGIGKMFDVDNDNWNVGWNTKQVLHVKIEYGVTSIGNYGFNFCSNLIDATISDSVLSIGNKAFSGCERLISVTIPNSVVSIGNEAFMYCTSLKNITIPKNVESIGELALSYLRSMTDIDVSSENLFFSSISGVLFNKDQTKLITCPAGKPGIYSIPDGVLDIGYCAFLDCSKLTAIFLSDSVINIGNYAFSMCRCVTNVSLSYNLKYIGDYAFNDCHSLSALSIPASVKKIGDNVFQCCYELTRLSISGAQVDIGENLFRYIGYSESGIPPTIYCYAYTCVDEWAFDKGYSTVYLDFESIDNVRTITLFEYDYIHDQLRNNHFLEIGGSRTLYFNVFPNDDHPIITWSSSDSSILSVNDGIITAHAEGKATIFATVGNASSSIEIITYTKNTFKLSPAEAWIIAKNDIQLSFPDVWIENGIEFCDWTSSDTKLATVNYSGKVATNFPGDVVICADTIEGLHAESLLHLCYPVTAISFSCPIYSVQLGHDYTLSANVTMCTQSCVNHLISFLSSDDTIATVDENGLVMPLKAGTVSISATADSGVFASCTVIVTDLAYTFSILPTGLNMIEDEAFAGAAFEAVIIPDGCTTIGPRAFADCPNLAYVLIPASVISIAPDAFEGCDQVVIDRIAE